MNLKFLLLSLCTDFFRSRKVRCDETHPTCRRCTNSGFVCEGYTNTRPASPLQDVSGPSLNRSTSTASLHVDSPATPETDIQQKLLRILQSGNIEYIGRDALDAIIRTTSPLAPSSLTAIPALELLVQRDSGDAVSDPESRLQVDTAYGQAIRLFVDEIRGDSGSSDAVFITGIILIAIELLQRRRQDAWKHLLGSRQWLRSTTSVDPHSGDIDFLYRIYDLQSLLYSHNVRFPMIEPHHKNTVEDSDLEALPFADLEKATINILHSAHVLLSKLHHLDILGTISVEKQDEEKMCQTRVDSAIQCIDSKLHLSSDPQKESAYLILRNLCLMTTMELEQSRCKDEMSWDKYEEKFQSIIEASERIQLRDQTSISSSGPSGHLHLTLQIGIISPLVLTAFKYRHPLWRRRAITCLHRAGIEGPFIGKQLSAIAERCIEIEESGTRQPSVSTPEGSSSLTRLSVRMPTEDKRLAHCRTDEDNGSADQMSWPQTAKGTTLVLFLARKAPAPVLAAKVLTSTFFSTSEEYRSLQDKTLDITTWRMWTETVQFNGSVG